MTDPTGWPDASERSAWALLRAGAVWTTAPLVQPSAAARASTAERCSARMESWVGVSWTTGSGLESYPLSSPRKRGSIFGRVTWIPACAGMTTLCAATSPAVSIHDYRPYPVVCLQGAHRRRDGDDHAPGGFRIQRGPPRKRARASRTSATARSVVSPTAPTWPIFRPGRGDFPYRCTLTPGISSASGQGGGASPSQRSPKRFAMAHGRTTSGDPSGRSHTDRTACSNWLVSTVSSVW